VPLRTWSQAVVLVSLGGLCYANSLGAPFLFDDPAPGARLDPSTRPLVAASFELNRAWSGYATWSYHVLNVLVHLACGLLLLGVLRRALEFVAPRLAPNARAQLAFVVALLWTCHPLQTGAVTYLSQRAEALGTLFYLAHVYGFLRSVSSPRALPWQVLSLGALALGFATKEIIATAPLLMWLFDACFLAGGWLRALRRRPGFYLFVALASLWGAYALVLPQLFGAGKGAGFRGSDTTPLAYARTQPGVLLHYLRLVVWPEPLCLDYGWPIARTLSAWLPQTLVVLTLLATSLGLLRRRPALGYAGCAFFAILAPTSSFVPIDDAAFEHRMYLALAVPLVLLVAGLAALCTRLAPRAKGVAPALTGLAVLVASAATVRRNQDYREPVRLFEKAVRVAPHHARAHLQLGTELLEVGRLEEAIAAAQTGLRLEPENGFGYLVLGKAYLLREEYARAVPLLERAAERIDDPRMQDTLGGALYLAGDPARAAAHLERAHAAHPTYAPTLRRLGEALADAGRPQEARQRYEEALQIDPGFTEVYPLLAGLLLAEGRAAESLQKAEVACRLAPDLPDGFFALAQALRELGRTREALEAFQHACTLGPELYGPQAEFAQTVARLPDATDAERREALTRAERAVVLAGSARPDLLLVRAEAEAGLGRWEQALSSLDQALALPTAHQDPGLAQLLRARRSDYAARVQR
jgi:tetratricopeptide (TPR) repeat protein